MVTEDSQKEHERLERRKQFQAAGWTDELIEEYKKKYSKSYAIILFIECVAVFLL